MHGPDAYGMTRVGETTTHFVDVLPLTFGRGRLVLTPKSAPLTYDDSW